MARFDVGYLAAQLVDAEDAALDQRLADGVDPALYRSSCRKPPAEAFDVAPELVHGHEAVFARQQTSSASTRFSHST
jgi:hypothetical protein